MQEKKLTGPFRTFKVVQLCVLLVSEGALLVLFMRDKKLLARVYSDRELFFLCAAVWGLLIFNLVCLLSDFFELRAYAAQNQTFVQKAYLDTLTGIPNKRGLDDAFEMYSTPESLKEVGCAMVTIRNLRRINEKSGRAAGDRVILDFCSIFEELGDQIGFVGRNGGNEFVLVMDQCREEDLQKFLTALENRLLLYNQSHADTPVEIDSACAVSTGHPVKSFSQLLAIAYGRLYRL